MVRCEDIYCPYKKLQPCDLNEWLNLKAVNVLQINNDND